MNYELEKIRNFFRELYGSLPVTELVANTALIRKIEEIETQLRRLIENEPTA